MSTSIAQKRIMRTEPIFYVYFFYRGESTVPFYIGKGCKKRIDGHEYCARKHATCKHLTCRIIRKEWREGRNITKVKIADGITEQAAFSLEKLFIDLGAVYKWPLVNKTFGGEGVSGYIRDKEWRARRSKLAKELVKQGKFEHLKTVNAGRIHTQEERRKRSESIKRATSTPEAHALKILRSKEMWKSETYRENHRRAMHTPEAHEKLAYWKGKESAQAKTYPGFIAPDGTIYQDVKNLTRFAKEHGLLVSALCCVAQGKVASHKGWKRYPPLPEKEARYQFTDPEGKIHRVVNLSAFCREHNLDAKAMSDVAFERRSIHDGWQKYPPQVLKQYQCAGFRSPDGTEYRDISKLKDFCIEHSLDYSGMAKVNTGKKRTHSGWSSLAQEAPKPKYNFIDPNGITYNTNNLTQFCREHGLDQASMSSVHSGAYRQYKGWKKST